MKKVKSKISLDINLSISESVNSIIIGTINDIKLSGDFQRIEISYTYETEAGAIVKKGKLVISTEEIDNLRTTVNSLLPNDYDSLDERDKMAYKYLNGFRVKLAETFNIQVTDTEIFE